MTDWNELVDEETLRNTVKALGQNGIEAVVAENGEEAKRLALGFIPEGSEVMTMSSVTLDTIGLTSQINESGKYNSIRKRLMTLDVKTQWAERQKLGAAPDYVVGSVQAVTTDGKVIIVSNSGSQLPAYASGAAHVMWIVGTNKIVSDLDTGMKRIYEHTLPLENERALKVYGVSSNVSKILIINKETKPKRITIILVKEKLGF